MPSPPDGVEEAIRLPWGPKEVMDSSLPIEVVIAREPTVKAGIKRGIKDSKAGRIGPWLEGKGQPAWLTRFSVDAEGARGAGGWTVYRDNGGQWAVARRPAHWRHGVYQKTEFWLIKKGETFGDRVRSGCLWRGRLNNSIEITMLHTLGDHDRIDAQT